MSQILQRVAPIGEARDREILKSASTYVYAQRPQGDVQAHLFVPEKPAKTPRAVIVFFHGGFWETATPAQFVPHCLHFANRGIVAVAAETRVSSVHGTGPLEALEDARDLIRWLRANADLFQIDPNRVIVGGAAGGAFLALQTTLPTAKKLPPKDGFDCSVQAMVLFSALVDTTRPFVRAKFPDAKTAKSISPSRMLRRKLPPMLIFHGTADRITPYDDVMKFRSRSRWRGNHCEIVDFPRADHSFFNFNVNHNLFEAIIGTVDRFLSDRGFLAPDDSAGQSTGE
ncbi:MAG: alpha/beta hydrolase [Verrucomicrobiota bacterium]